MARESLTLPVRDLLAEAAPHAHIDSIDLADPLRVVVTVIAAGGTERTLYIARRTLGLFRELGLSPPVESLLRLDPATRWVMEEAEREAAPGSHCHRAA